MEAIYSNLERNGKAVGCIFRKITILIIKLILNLQFNKMFLWILHLKTTQKGNVTQVKSKIDWLNYVSNANFKSGHMELVFKEWWIGMSNGYFLQISSDQSTILLNFDLWQIQNKSHSNGIYYNFSPYEMTLITSCNVIYTIFAEPI